MLPSRTGSTVHVVLPSDPCPRLPSAQLRITVALRIVLQRSGLIRPLLLCSSSPSWLLSSFALHTTKVESIDCVSSPSSELEHLRLRSGERARRRSYKCMRGHKELGSRVLTWRKRRCQPCQVAKQDRPREQLAVLRFSGARSEKNNTTVKHESIFREPTITQWPTATRWCWRCQTRRSRSSKLP